ncbi:MAG: preprotein translocase subunit SecG [Bacteroidales bacterium]
MGTYILLSVLILITCVLLVLIVLVQNSKGGGLASNFSGSNQVMGVRKTTDFLEKTTWTLAIVLLVLTLTSTFVIPRGEIQEAAESEVRDLVPAREAAPMEMDDLPPADAIPEDADQVEDVQAVPDETDDMPDDMEDLPDIGN